jgi:hypothetical protein
LLNKHNMSKDKKKNIYNEDRIFAAQNKNGDWYLSFTTLDRDEKFKQRRIASIDGRPPKEMIEEKEVKNDKVRYYLDKEKSAEFIEDEYKFFVVNEPSPWRPKKFGEKSTTKMDSSDASSSEEETFEAPKKKQKTEDGDLRKVVGDCYALLLEISTYIRSSMGSSDVHGFHGPVSGSVVPNASNGN